MKLTNRRLGEACLELGGTVASRLEAEAASQPEHFFSPGFNESMDKLIVNAKKKYNVRQSLRRVAAVLIAVLCGIGAIKAFPEASAAVSRWIRELYSGGASYDFSGDNYSALPLYSLGWLPEGFELTDSMEAEQMHDYVYKNGAEEQIVFSYMRMNSGGETEYEFREEEYAAEKVTVNGLFGEIYICLSGEATNNLIWIDEANEMVFTLDARLDKADMLRIAESVYLVE